MYDTASQLFVALFVIAYLAILAALTWWVLGLRLGRARRKIVAPASASGRRTVGLSAGHLKGRESSAATHRALPLLFALFVGASGGIAQTPDPTRPQPAEASIEGVVTVNDQVQVSAVPGVRVTLTPTSAGSPPLTTASNAEGRYQFRKVAVGVYTIEANLEGFKPFAETVAVRPAEVNVKDVSLELDKVILKVEVRDKPETVSIQPTNPAATVSSRQFIILPLAEQKFDAVLPLVPGVVRTRDGKLNLKGVPENQGMLEVDSAQTVDPVTGSFSIPIPLDAIERLSVYKTPYSSEYGDFSGGLTAIETKSPSGSWHYDVMDFIPGVRGKAGHIVGISDDTPRLYFGGPLVKDKLNFSEAFTYDVRKTPVRGLAWPYNETKRQGFNTLTTFQAVLSPRHLLSVNVNGFSNRTQFADISALVPQTASSDEGQRGVSLGAADSYQFSSGALLTTIFRYTRFDSNAHGQGPEEMLITPEGWGGNFFNAWTRTSNQFELLPIYRFPVKEWWGRHELKVGGDFTHRSYDGTSYSHPIQLLRQDGSLAERIDFLAGSPLKAQDTEVAEFVHDHWTLNERLALDLGGRLLSQSIGRSAAFAPRVGLVYSPGEDHKTIIRAGAGLFYDRGPLLAADFVDNPTRAVTLFDETGIAIGPPVVFPNVYLQSVPGFGIVPTKRALDTTPRNFTWNFEVDRELWHGLVIRATYLYSQTQNLYVVTPLTASGAASLLGLANNGGSHYHELEATLHYRAGERSEFNLSYVRSHARGDLNTLSDVFVPFEQPVIRPNVTGILAQDVPNRVIGWGAFPLPWNLTLSPVVDVHSGLPYSEVDTLQNYVGAPNNQRFPTFFSLDLKVYREFRMGSLPLVGRLGRLRNQTLRLGVYSINLTNHSNALDVYNNVTSPYFGHFVGFQHRVDGLVIDVVN